MQMPLLLRRPTLETRLIPGHSTEILPYPPQHLLALLHATEPMRRLLLQLLQLLLRLFPLGNHPPRPDQ